MKTEGQINREQTYYRSNPFSTLPKSVTPLNAHGIPQRESTFGRSPPPKRSRLWNVAGLIGAGLITGAGVYAQQKFSSDYKSPHYSRFNVLDTPPKGDYILHDGEHYEVFRPRKDPSFPSIFGDIKPRSSAFPHGLPTGYYEIA
jgi:hypothetical protein